MDHSKNKPTNTLTLPLKRKWFDLIKIGEKKEEYREINDYWKKRLVYKLGDRHNGILTVLESFDNLVLTLGYPRKDDADRHLFFRNPRIRIGEGKQEWGAEPGKRYFVITWEE